MYIQDHLDQMITSKLSLDFAMYPTNGLRLGVSSDSAVTVWMELDGMKQSLQAEATSLACCGGGWAKS